MVGVPRQIMDVYLQVVIGVQLPKLAVDDVEMLVGKEISDLKSKC